MQWDSYITLNDIPLVIVTAHQKKASVDTVPECYYVFCICNSYLRRKMRLPSQRNWTMDTPHIS